MSCQLNENLNGMNQEFNITQWINGDFCELDQYLLNEGFQFTGYQVVSPLRAKLLYQTGIQSFIVTSCEDGSVRPMYVEDININPTEAEIVSLKKR